MKEGSRRRLPLFLSSCLTDIFIGFAAYARQDRPARSGEGSLGVIVAGSACREAYLRAEIARPRRAPSIQIARLCPIALRGTREYLWAGRWIPRRGPIHVFVGHPIIPKGKDWREILRLREAAKEAILRHCGEPALNRVAAEIPEE